MPKTELKTGQYQDGSVRRDDLNVQTPGQAVVRKIVQGSGIVLSATGADAGTGDVTVALDPNPSLTTLNIPTTLGLNGDGAIFDYGSKFLGIPFVERGDMLRWKSPSVAQFYDFGTSSWSLYNSPNWKLLTDGKGDTRIALDYTHRKIRLTYDLANDYHVSNVLLIQRNYSWPVNSVTVTLEESSDNSTWTTRVSARVVELFDTVIIRPDDGYSIWRRYQRITLEFNNGVNDTMYLAGLQLWTYRNGDQGAAGLHKQLPFDWDENRNLILPGTLTLPNGNTLVGESGRMKLNKHLLVQGPDGYNASGEEAILYLGDTNVALRARWGVGFSINVAGMTDAFSIEENTGNVVLSGSFRPNGGYLSSQNNPGLNQTIEFKDLDGRTLTLVFEDGLLISYSVS